MFDVKTGEGFDAGRDAEGRPIPTAEFRASIRRHYERRGLPYREPKWFNNPIVARAFDAAPRPFSLETHAKETQRFGEDRITSDRLGPARRYIAAMQRRYPDAQFTAAPGYEDLLENDRSGSGGRSRVGDGGRASDLEHFEAAARDTCGC